MKLETTCLHGGQAPDPSTNARAVPVHRTASYVFDSTEHAANLFALKELGNIYSRIMNPTTDVLEKRVALLEGAPEPAGLGFSSGTAAIFNTIINLASAGDNIVSSPATSTAAVLHPVQRHPPGPRHRGALRRFRQTPRTSRKATDDKTRAYFTETVLESGKLEVFRSRRPLPTSPTSHGLPLIVDSTFSTPYLTRPLAHGADIVVHSLHQVVRRPRHWHRRHGGRLRRLQLGRRQASALRPRRTPPTTACAGATTFPSRWHRSPSSCACVTVPQRDLGACDEPLQRTRGCSCNGLETLPLRMERHSQNADKPWPLTSTPTPRCAVGPIHPSLDDGPEYAAPTSTYLRWQGRLRSAWSASSIEGESRGRAASFIDVPQDVLPSGQHRRFAGVARHSSGEHDPFSQLSARGAAGHGHPSARATCGSRSASSTSTTSSPTSTRPSASAPAPECGSLLPPRGGSGLPDEASGASVYLHPTRSPSPSRARNELIGPRQPTLSSSALAAEDRAPEPKPFLQEQEWRCAHSIIPLPTCDPSASGLFSLAPEDSSSSSNSMQQEPRSE